MAAFLDNIGIQPEPEARNADAISWAVAAGMLVK
jgi:hypothetical protein